MTVCANIGEAPVIAKGGLDLRGQFARRLEHEAAEFPVMAEQGQNGQSERRGFASPGLGGADEIFAGENNGKSAKLDRRRFGETHRLRPAHDFRREPEIIERHSGRTNAGPALLSFQAESKNL